MNYKFIILDPHPDKESATIDFLKNNQCLGIEVTIKKYSELCSLKNIDPQHEHKDLDITAIETAALCELPPDGSTLVTIRPDMDSIGSFAIIALRAEKKYEGLSKDILPRLEMIALYDKFAQGSWVPQTLPSISNPWPDKRDHYLAAINLAVADHKITIEERVDLMKRWIMTGEEPVEYRILAEKNRQDLIDALEKGYVLFNVHESIAEVITTLPWATKVGYSLAPVVIAVNPAFSFHGGPKHRKITICQYENGHIDMEKISNELSEYEPGWGGSPNIIGSPQGVGTIWTTENVLATVRKFKLK